MRPARRPPLALAALAVIAGCSIRIPDATYVCGPSEGCPSGFVCSEGLCRRTAVEVDANTCVAETCNGLDDDCDGFVDDGVLALQEPTPLAPSRYAKWTRLLPLPGNGSLVVSSFINSNGDATEIFATRFDAGGAVVAGPTEIVDSGESRFEATTIGANFYVIRAGVGQNSLVLDQFDVATLARVGAETMISPSYVPESLDLIAHATTSGDRVVVAYATNGEVRVRSVAVPSLLDDEEHVIQTETVDDPILLHLRLAAAPCSKGLYLVGFRELPAPEVRIVPLDVEAAPVAPPFEFSADAPSVVTGVSRPILVGGDCADAPTTMHLGWIESDDRPSGSPTFSRVHVDTIRITRSTQAPTQVLERIDRVDLESPKFAVPQVVFSILEPVSLVRIGDGRLFAAVASVSSDFLSGDLDVFEILPDGTTFRYGSTLAPVFTAAIDGRNLGSGIGGIRFATSLYSDERAAALYGLGCSP